MAKNAKSTMHLHTDDPRAARFCAMGSLHRACYELEPGNDATRLMMAVRVLQNALPPICGGDVTLFNDNPFRKKADVLALFDAACERVGKS